MTRLRLAKDLGVVHALIARSLRRRLGLEFHSPETQQLEIGVTGVARSAGEARRPTSRAYVSSRPLVGARNSAIGTGQRRAVAGATEIVATDSRR